MKIGMLSFWDKYIDIDLGVGVIPKVVRDYTVEIGHQKIDYRTWIDTIPETPERRQLITSNFVQKTMQLPVWYAHDTLYPYPLQKVKRFNITGYTTNIPPGSSYQVANPNVEGYVENITLATDSDGVEYTIYVDDKEYFVSCVADRVEREVLFTEFQHTIVIYYCYAPPRYVLQFRLPVYIRNIIRIVAHNVGDTTVEYCFINGYVYGYTK